MGKKKINFSKRPTSIEDSKIIDDWVLADNNKPSHINTLNEKRFTIVMPEELYRKLKVKCAKNDLRLKDFIINSLENNLMD